MALKVKPLSDRVVVEPAPAEDVSTGGIILPDTAPVSYTHLTLPTSDLV